MSTFMASDPTFDPAQQAVRIERLEGQQALLAERVSAGMTNVANTMASVQVEVRGLNAKFSDFAGVPHVNESNKDAISDLKKALSDLNSRLEDWFDDFEQRSQQRWDKFEKQRDEWRKLHEAENEDDKRELERELRSVRETVIRGIGFGTALGTLASVIIGGFLWNVNYRFNEGREDITEVRSATVRNAASMQQIKDDVLDVKLYLSRGGRIPAEPYVPQGQRKPDDQRKP